jgi:uncharacterized damage-inducible protein DinB
MVAVGTDQYLVALERENAAFGAAAARHPLDSSVPATPGWSLADLVYHLTEVQDFWRRIVEGRLTTADGLEATPRAPDEALVATFEAGAAQIAATDLE